jgi:hypothetical protein
MHALAGFTENEPYFVARDLLTPPENLQKKVFPWVDEWLTKIENGDVEKSDKVASKSFLRLMVFLRKVLFQVWIVCNLNL